MICYGHAARLHFSHVDSAALFHKDADCYAAPLMPLCLLDATILCCRLRLRQRGRYAHIRYITLMLTPRIFIDAIFHAAYGCRC